MSAQPEDDWPRDYLGRVVCKQCRHTIQMHAGTVCLAMGCYCRIPVEEWATRPMREVGTEAKSDD